MDIALFMDFELNNPLTYLSKFKKLVKDEGWVLDLFWASDYTKKKRPSVDEKISKANFLIIRKPLTFLSSATIRSKLQEIIRTKKKNLLIMYTFTEFESLGVLNQFLEPFKIQLSELQIIDNTTNQNDTRTVVFHKKNKCFNHKFLFNGVQKVTIPHPHHMYLTKPAKILIRGNPSSEIKDSIYMDTSNLKGSDLIVGAYHESNGKILVLDSTLFLDQYFDYNKKFISNVFHYLAEK